MVRAIGHAYNQCEIVDQVIYTEIKLLGRLDFICIFFKGENGAQVSLHVLAVLQLSIHNIIGNSQTDSILLSKINSRA